MKGRDTNKKINTDIFILARLDSKRLPNKQLIEIGGIPSLKLLINRIKFAKKFRKIIVCTTTRSIDEPLIKFLEKEKIEYFRGSKKSSASIAKERLQIIVAHQRGGNIDFLPLLEKELIAVISKYVSISADQVKVELDKSGDTSVLELNVTLPNHAKKDEAASKQEEKV